MARIGPGMTRALPLGPKTDAKVVVVLRTPLIP